jgi:HSP20 family protein
MFGITRGTSLDDVLNLHREVDRLFNQAWSEMPLRNASPSIPFHVRSTDDGWRVDVPLPGIDPNHVRIEAAGSTISIRVETPRDEQQGSQTRFEQTVAVPQFADLEKLSATHRHGMLSLTVPIKDSVKPRQIDIKTYDSEKQLTGSSS